MGLTRRLNQQQARQPYQEAHDARSGVDGIQAPENVGGGQREICAYAVLTARLLGPGPSPARRRRGAD
eukprot:2074880-Alexandrium_andersonii.AAC.1